MKLIIGLGNPGKVYADSRHNIGFSAIRALTEDYKGSLKKERNIFCLSAKVKINNREVVLALPLTFMNLSGVAVKALVKKYKIDDSGNLLVICDDLDLEFGSMKLRPSGSSGGHRGLESIINCTGTNDFARLRIGIGRPGIGFDISEYVLAPFSKAEKGQVREIIEKAVDCCQSWVSEGVSKSMGTFNKKTKI